MTNQPNQTAIKMIKAHLKEMMERQREVAKRIQALEIENDLIITERGYLEQTLYKIEKAMEEGGEIIKEDESLCVGDLAKPIGDARLFHGDREYIYAVVISVDPFVLVSEDAGMRWGGYTESQFVKSGKIVNKEVLNGCMERLEK